MLRTLLEAEGYCCAFGHTATKTAVLHHFCVVVCSPLFNDILVTTYRTVLLQRSGRYYYPNQCHKNITMIYPPYYTVLIKDRNSNRVSLSRRDDYNDERYKISTFFEIIHKRSTIPSHVCRDNIQCLVYISIETFQPHYMKQETGRSSQSSFELNTCLHHHNITIHISRSQTCLGTVSVAHQSQPYIIVLLSTFYL